MTQSQYFPAAFIVLTLINNQLKNLDYEFQITYKRIYIRRASILHANALD